MLMVPSLTSAAPIQRKLTTAENAIKITIAVITARVAIRRFAATKLFSVTPWNLARDRFSWVNACTVCADSSCSDASPDDTAIQSWFSRLSLRTRRPNNTTGINTTGIGHKTRPVIFTDVHNIRPMPPNKISTLRNAIDTDDPITDKISVVSVVIRLRTSPVITRSKNAGDMPIILSKTATRISATMRSPRRVTR